MKNAKTYLKKNGFFIFLLTFIVLIIIALSLYMFVNANTDTPIENGNITENPVEEKEEPKTAEITSLETEYNKTLRYINVSWTYEEHESDVVSTYLYVNDTLVDNVSSYSSYQIAKDAYHYPTGNNTVKLVLNLANGETVEKTSTVFVNYVVDTEQSVKQENNSTILTLCYQYDESNPVDVPSIFITDASVSTSKIEYIDTKRSTRDGSVYAETSYRIVWSENPVTYQTFGVRWSFKDIQYSRDFEAEKGVPTQESEE